MQSLATKEMQITENILQATQMRRTKFKSASYWGAGLHDIVRNEPNIV